MHRDLLRQRRRVAAGKVLGLLFSVAGLAVAGYFAFVQFDEPLAVRGVGSLLALTGSVSGVLVTREFHRLRELPWHDPGLAQAKVAQRLEPLAGAGTIAAIACSLAAVLASRLS